MGIAHPALVPSVHVDQVIAEGAPSNGKQRSALRAAGDAGR